MKTYTVYTDGSFGDNGEVHGGIVYWKDGAPSSKVHVHSKRPEFVSMRNVGGEVLAAWAAIMSVANAVKEENESTGLETYEMNLIYDYKGLGCWLTHEWKTNKVATQWFVKSVERILSAVPNLKVNYIWVKGHADTSGNNHADLVASYDMRYCKMENIPICDLDSVIDL